MEKQKLIISTEYPELVRFLFSNLRFEKEVPMRDNFLLIKTLSHKEFQMLTRFTNYVVISKSYATAEWGRDEIFEFCKSELKSRRKPSYSLMSDDDFIKNVKVFWITGKWVTEDIETGLFHLYQQIDSKSARWVEYYKMRELGVHPLAIFSSMLTFISKVFDVQNASGVSKGYLSVLLSKKGKIQENFKEAISNYAAFDKDIDPDFKVLRFLMDLGGGYR